MVCDNDFDHGCAFRPRNKTFGHGGKRVIRGSCRKLVNSEHRHFSRGERGSTGCRAVRLFVQKECHEFSVHLHAPVVIDQAQLAKPVHKEADTRAGGADHFGQGPLAHLQNGGMCLGWRPKSREKQKRPGQPLLAGVEELIDKVFFNSDHASNQVRDEQTREPGSSWMMRTMVALLHSRDGGRLDCRRARHPQGRHS